MESPTLNMRLTSEYGCGMVLDMTTTPLTLDVIQAEAHRVVEQFGPDHKNPEVEDANGCWYTNVDGEHCIAGQIVKNLGHDIPGWTDRDNGNEVPRVGLFRGLFTDEAEEWLWSVQSHADHGETWAESVQHG